MGKTIEFLTLMIVGTILIGCAKEEPVRRCQRIQPPTTNDPPLAPSSDFRVLGSDLKAQITSFDEQNCRVCVNFEGQIEAHGTGTVEYTFGRSDNATGPSFSLNFERSGVKQVGTTWQRGGVRSGSSYSIEGWQTIKIVSPNLMESDRAVYNLGCQLPK